MNSVDNVAKILRLFTPDRSVLSVTEVSQLLALPKSSTSRLLKAMAAAVRSHYDLAGRKVVVSAGGTREPIDPVRFLSNYSSGKMGFAVAAAAADRGARVSLVTTASHPLHHGVEVRQVETADEMLAALKSRPLNGSHIPAIAVASDRE